MKAQRFRSEAFLPLARSRFSPGLTRCLKNPSPWHSLCYLPNRTLSPSHVVWALYSSSASSATAGCRSSMCLTMASSTGAVETWSADIIVTMAATRGENWKFIDRRGRLLPPGKLPLSLIGLPTDWPYLASPNRALISSGRSYLGGASRGIRSTCKRASTWTIHPAPVESPSPSVRDRHTRQWVAAEGLRSGVISSYLP